MPSISETLEFTFRQEYGRIIATLIRLSGSFDQAEDALQEAFLKAVDDWNQTGIPKKPGAWLTTVARRKIIDSQRREKTRIEKSGQLQSEMKTEGITSNPSELDQAIPLEALEYPDDRLRLIFTCCHPALKSEAQIALTLRTLGGLSTPEIARAFLISESTLAQRLVRAKAKIHKAGIPYEIPAAEVLPQRLAAVQAVIYLIFNEGYSSTDRDRLVRGDLCHEAIRLARLLCELLPEEPENMGLLALLLLQDSRRSARTDKLGNLVILEEQDRSLWDQTQIIEGLQILAQARKANRVGIYQIQAAIASIHAQAKTPSDTQWAHIVGLYEILHSIHPTPVVQLNHAVAVAMSEGCEKGLELIAAAGRSGKLEDYPLFHAARADLFRRLGRNAEAASAYRRALEFTTNQVERRYLRMRLKEVRSA